MTVPNKDNCAPDAIAGIGVFRRLRLALAHRRHSLNVLKEGLAFMSQVVDEMVAAVAEEISVSDSVEVLLDELYRLFEATAGDQAKLTTLLADLRANKTKELAAVLRNTPAAP